MRTAYLAACLWLALAPGPAAAQSSAAPSGHAATPGVPPAAAPGAGPLDPAPLLPVPLADADKARFLAFETTRTRSVAAALASGAADAAALRQILAGDPQPIRDADLAGTWRCRSAQIDDGEAAGATAGVFVYPYFRCAITRRGGGFFLAKTNGSQRVSGTLHRVAPDRFAFLGGATVNDEPQRAYGASAEGNVVAYLVKAGAGRLRLEMPQTCCSTLEILELVR